MQAYIQLITTLVGFGYVIGLVVATWLLRKLVLHFVDRWKDKASMASFMRWEEPSGAYFWGISLKLSTLIYVLSWVLLFLSLILNIIRFARTGVL